MTTHTPGPWEWDGKFTVCIPHEKGLTCFRTNPEDAALIVKAPELYDAVAAATDKLELMLLERDRANQMLDGMTAVANEQRQRAEKAEARAELLMEELCETQRAAEKAEETADAELEAAQRCPAGWVMVPRELIDELRAGVRLATDAKAKIVYAPLDWAERMLAAVLRREGEESEATKT